MDLEAGRVVEICAEDLESEISLWLRGHICLRTSSVKTSVPSFPLACEVRHFLPGILSLCFPMGRAGNLRGTGKRRVAVGALALAERASLCGSVRGLPTLASGRAAPPGGDTDLMLRSQKSRRSARGEGSAQPARSSAYSLRKRLTLVSSQCRVLWLKRKSSGRKV